MERDQVKDSDMVRVDNWCTARETLELAYSWDIKNPGRQQSSTMGIMWNIFNFE